MPYLRQRSIGAQVRMALGLLALLMSLGSVGLLILARRASQRANEIYQDHLHPMLQLMEVSEAYSVDITMAMRGVRAGRIAPEAGLRILQDSEARARVAWDAYKAHRGGEEALRVAEEDLVRLHALEARLKDLMPQASGAVLGTFGDNEWMPEVSTFSRALQNLRSEEDRRARVMIRELELSAQRTLAMGVVMISLTFLLALGLGWRFATHLRQGVASLVARLRQVADGDLDPVPEEPGEGELAIAERELNRTVARLRQLLLDLHAQKALERAILDGARAAIIGLDLEGRVSRWNRAAELMTGYTAEEVLGKATPLLWRLPDELDVLAREVSERLGRTITSRVEALQAASDIPGFATECHYRHKDGSLVPVLLSISRVRGLDGDLLGTMGVALDMRDIERLKAALKASEARYRRLAEHLPGVVYQTQIWPDGRRAWPFIGPQFSELYGADKQAWEEDPGYVIGKLHPEDRAEYQRLHQEATRNLTPLSWTGRTFTSRPGEMKWIRARSNPTPQADGSILWDGLMEDVTELKRAEEALKQSEARAQEASKAKSAFLASMSHELRTPLSAILGYSRLMAREPLRSEEDRVQLEHVLRAGEHLLALINDVLSLSKIEAGKMELRRVPFDPSVLVNELDSLFRLTALSKGLAFAVEAKGLPPQVEGDPAKLRQVLVNLLGNALKFTTHGMVRLQIEWSDEVFAASVEDTGAGISEAEQAQLFGAFNQTSQGHAAGGTGLGLHISQALVAIMGGGIGVSSVPGQGSRFYFDIPLPVPEVPALLSTQGRVLQVAEGGPQRHILVVDDRPENRDILDRLLRMVGFRCSLAEHGRAGLEQWREGRPDLVLMDLRMPEMDGFEAVARMRQSEANLGIARTPVIAISASVYDVSREDLIQRGFDAFLTKPIEEEQLFAALEAHLGLRFEREADTLPAPGTVGLEALARQDPDWRSRFQEEVAVGDLEAAEALLVEVPDQALVQALRQRLRAYNLEDILQHLN
ncbi:hypothetical protein GETHLI_18600 [Geothrix limicola]|uniref:histidine kinase n=1 Tax=Geothrix limicola TaxID=2927978 RepID=A0ABQ5QF95_9BACT|nr:response regulator [Geothrix limicola]GLH73358.1 hypothetical protein GETHLI_18600 [Geothrix limicola]